MTPSETSPNQHPWRPLGEALKAFSEAGSGETVQVLADGAPADRLTAAYLHRSETEFPDPEAAALGLARGRVLDIGAGAGAHALELQRRGIEVTALDISPEAVAVMKRRGIVNARVGDIFDFEDPDGFDTLLLLMNGIGVVGTLPGLDRFLTHAKKLLAPGGQILADSADLRRSEDADTLDGIARREREGRYFGQVRFELVFKSHRGRPFDWLFLDPDTFSAHARAKGWRFQIVFENEEGDYLARLTRSV